MLRRSAVICKSEGSEEGETIRMACLLSYNNLPEIERGVPQGASSGSSVPDISLPVHLGMRAGSAAHTFR